MELKCYSDFMNVKKGTNWSFLLSFALIALAIGAGGYFEYDDYLQRQNNLALESEISRTTNNFIVTTKGLNSDIESLNSVLDSTKSELAATIDQRNYLGDQYNIERNKINGLTSQISDIQGTVSDLQKLKQIDPELLKKYSKVYFLNENYVPASLTAINPADTYNPKDDYLILTKVLPFLNNLMSVAKADGMDIEVVSAYRSFNEQSSLKSSYKVVYGIGANKFSADQGYSEHQMGTTVDFTTKDIGAGFTGFEKSATYQWLLDNAYTYGFVLSYPKGNSYYQFEPWHWRFVGRALAQKLHDDGKNFYDLDQREIDKYLISFFD